MSDVVPMTEMTSERIPSGIPGLDVVLGGGFLRNGTYIVMGPPGAGKTILGNQICFHHVAAGGRALYVTLLAESHARMIAHMRAMRFFDPARVADALSYISGYRELEERGLDGLLELIRKLIREHGATLLVIDGLVSAHAFAQTDLAFKKFIHGINTLVPFLQCTTFLLTNGPTNLISPEHTMVDGLVELADPVIGVRAVRELMVRKFRGSDHLRGKHKFEITSDGVVVHPRLEALATRQQRVWSTMGGPLGEPSSPPNPPKEDVEKRRLGVEGLDGMLAGGLPSGSITMVLGPSGSGKTTLGLSFLAEGARAGERGLYFGFFEPPPRLLAKGDGLGLGLRRHVDQGLLHVEWQPPLELIIDAAAERLLALVRQERVRRLFLDGVGAFYAAAFHPKRLGRFFAALANELRALDVTTVFSQETQVLFGPGIKVPVAGLSATSDNILFLRQVEHGSRMKRVLSVIKTRESDHDTEIREFAITGRGIEIGATLGDGVEAILTGIVHARAGARSAAPAGPKGRGQAGKPRRGKAR